MNFTSIRLFAYSLLLLLVQFHVLPAQAQTQQALQGIWLGKLEIKPDQQMTVAIEVKQDGQAFMHSIDQNVYDIAIEEYSLKGDEVTIQIKSLNATYKGKIVGADAIQGGLAQNATTSFPLNFKKVDSLPRNKPRRPQEPTGKLPYTEEKVSYRNAHAGVRLAGTLTLPQAPGPHPAVVLVSGSGPTDRNATVFGHKVFLVWADLLTRAGYAVLRVDDRGVGESEGNYEAATLEDHARDALAGVAYLKTRKEVDAQKVGLVGHSLGAEIAPIAAAQSQEVAFIVLMAGPGEPLTQGLITQSEAIYAQAGASKEGIALNTKILETVIEVIRSEKDSQAAKQKLARELEKFNPALARLSAEDLKKLELSYPIKPTDFSWFLTPGGRSELLNQPTQALQRVNCPVLAMNGTKDVQVGHYNLPLIEKALRKGGNKQVSIKRWENKNHLFQTAETGSVPEYGEIEETVAPEVIAYMVDWMNSLNTTSKK
ncbi:hypothetical protein CLV24_104133 [Pontibacter ummariensis]|uniref:Xaa-Pro dipeptidyl-peptidase-like domain-containing protein n=1 Tax=Pontibacter ummariensis TaxID=1610492 RepID=A0A239DBW5_9BACT|nr:alpha/beta fold hydrolase [Pontibacter ummariensis]PRY14323.1 hypothetical protein CLV24_104133 [Pontibacter ummariensis]SNS29183.1 hypothetical protein SAMN06296052_104132 [Pontibacter ummariensis]